MADDINDDDGGAGGDGGQKKVKSNYRVPPPGHQFQPGKSGNPRGRPKGALGLKAELQAELNEYVTITVDGKQRRIRKRRLIIKALAARAAKGDVKAAEKLLALVIQAEGFEPEAPVKRRLSENDQQILDQFLGEPDAWVNEVSEAEDAPEAGEPSPVKDSSHGTINDADKSDNRDNQL